MDLYRDIQNLSEGKMIKHLEKYQWITSVFPDLDTECTLKTSDWTDNYQLHENLLDIFNTDACM